MVLTRKATYIISIVYLVGCTQPDEKGDELQFYGLEDKAIINLRLYGTDVYACTGSNGLWMKSTLDDGDWISLGLTDTSLGNYRNRGVQDVIRNNGNEAHLIVAFQPDLASDHRIYKSLNGGITWTTADRGLEVYIDGLQYYSGIERLFYGAGGALIGVGTGGIYQTNNFGESWERIDSTLGAATVYVVSSGPLDEPIWIGGDGFFFEPVLSLSMDGGESWQHKSASIPGRYRFDNAVRSIASTAEGNTHIGLFHSTILSSYDLGQNWNTIIVDSLVQGSVNSLKYLSRKSELIASIISYVYVTDSDHPDQWEIALSSSDFNEPVLIYGLHEILGTNKILISTSSGVYQWLHK